MKLIDLSGRTFGALMATLRSGSTASGKARWLCVCRCGNRITATGELLIAARVKSCGCLCEGRRLGTAEERFDSRYAQVPWSGCWIWTGKANVRGYGVLAVGDRKVLAHRFSYARFRGPIPPGLFVCHVCDVSWCVNPAHLFIGTQADNVADAIRKGRDNCYKKLTVPQVAEIRAACSRGESQRAIALRFSVDPSNVSRIVHEETWKKKEALCA